MDVDRTSWRSTLVKNHDENKTYILVKLSESFSNAIQEYSAAQSIAKQSSTSIKFHGSRGAIRFPNGKSYDFSLEQSDNSVECIKQTRNKWESVGKMACCLHVKGKDDVYQRTKTKMEAAEQEKRKYCTKLLGSPENHTKSIKLLSSSSSTSSHNHIKGRGSNHYHNSYHNNHRHQVNNNHHNSSASISNNNNNINNYVNLSKYPDITDVKQMKKYKADFDKDFKEYQNLHGYLHRIEERFKKLRESLKQSVEGSPEWETAKEQIFDEYERVKGDSNFHRARSKYKQLYNKLAHIKEKIFQYKRQKKRK